MSLKAFKNNGVITIQDNEEEAYLARGFDIYDTDYKVKKKSESKDISASRVKSMVDNEVKEKLKKLGLDANGKPLQDQKTK